MALQRRGIMLTKIRWTAAIQTVVEFRNRELYVLGCKEISVLRKLESAQHLPKG